MASAISENANAVSIQLWPRGGSVTYRGDIHSPSIEIKDGETWRPATHDEHRQVRINELAKLYAERDVLCCDSSLVSDLLQAGGDDSRLLDGAFSYDNVENLRPNPSNWTLKQCIEWLKDRGGGMMYPMRQNPQKSLL